MVVGSAILLWKNDVTGWPTICNFSLESVDIWGPTERLQADYTRESESIYGYRCTYYTAGKSTSTSDAILIQQNHLNSSWTYYATFSYEGNEMSMKFIYPAHSH